MAKLPMAEVLRTRTISEPRGFMKALIAKNSDQILGLTAFGSEASELMAAMQTAMLGHLAYTVVRRAAAMLPQSGMDLLRVVRAIRVGRRAVPASQWKALAPPMHWSELTRSSVVANTQSSLPSEDAVFLLLFGLVRIGQVTLRPLVGWQDLNSLKSQAAA
jgi:hypothetical protein